MQEEQFIWLKRYKVNCKFICHFFKTRKQCPVLLHLFHGVLSFVEFMTLTAWGMTLLCSLVVWQLILMYFLPDGSRANRLWLGCVWYCDYDIINQTEIAGPQMYQDRSLSYIRLKESWLPPLRFGIQKTFNCISCTFLYIFDLTHLVWFFLIFACSSVLFATFHQICSWLEGSMVASSVKSPFLSLVLGQFDVYGA